ncbi:MAG TPA: preprotein translocase subunit YajC [Gaiellaceae bacterium]|nr:preprotein translocase subunit YajC [Gaiellaceae bacterium]
MNAGPLIFLLAMAALLWFLLIRPQRQRQAAHARLLAEVTPGDEIVTVGGLFGTVRQIADDHILLEVAPGTEIRLAREAITGIRRKDEEAPTEASEAEHPG